MRRAWSRRREAAIGGSSAPYAHDGPVKGVLGRRPLRPVGALSCGVLDPKPIPWRHGVVVALVCVVLAAASLAVPSVPTYDPMAWLVWGREISSGELHTTGGPSTDGTGAGTKLLRRFEGDFLDLPTGFTHFDGVTWFVAEDDAHGFELWRTDGTPEGTQLARDIVPGPESSFPGDLVVTDDFLFFTAYDDEHGAEPWLIRPAAPTAEEPPPADDGPPVRISPLPLPDTPKPGGADARDADGPRAAAAFRARRDALARHRQRLRGRVQRARAGRARAPRASAQASHGTAAPVPVRGGHRHEVAIERTVAASPHGAVRGPRGRAVPADSRRNLSGRVERDRIGPQASVERRASGGAAGSMVRPLLEPVGDN